MKIKTKKKMTPEEYAKYMIDNHGIRGYESKLIDNYLPGAPERFSQKFELNPTSKEDVLTGSFRNGELEVEIEEEITEDTEIKGLVEFGNDGYGPHFFQCSGSSINEQKDFDSEAFYIMNDDKTMTLIWKNGKMVE